MDKTVYIWGAVVCLAIIGVFGDSLDAIMSIIGKPDLFGPTKVS